MPQTLQSSVIRMFPSFMSEFATSSLKTRSRSIFQFHAARLGGANPVAMPLRFHHLHVVDPPGDSGRLSVDQTLDGHGDEVGPELEIELEGGYVEAVEVPEIRDSALPS